MDMTLRQKFGWRLMHIERDRYSENPSIFASIKDNLYMFGTYLYHGKVY